MYVTLPLPLPDCLRSEPIHRCQQNLEGGRGANKICLLKASGWEEKALCQCGRKAMVQQRGRLHSELIKSDPTTLEWIHRRWSSENPTQSQHLIRTWTSLDVNHPEDKSLLETDFHKTTWIINLVILSSLALATPWFLLTSRFYPRCLVAKRLGISTNYDKMCSFEVT